MTSDPIVALVLLFLLLDAAIIVGLHRRRDEILQVLVGVTAGLEFAQIANVHLFTVATFAWLLFSRRKPTDMTASPMTLPLCFACGLLAMTSFTGSLVASHTLALQFVGFVGTAVLIGMFATPRAVTNMARGLIAITVFAALYAIGQRAGVVALGSFEDYSSEGRVMGIYHEPDWLGFFCAAGILAAIHVAMPRWLKTGVFLILGAGIVLSFARAQFVGVAAVLVVVVGYSIATGRYRWGAGKNAAPLAVAAAVGAVALAMSPAALIKIEERVVGAIDSKQQDIGTYARYRQQASLRQMAGDAPWYGYGLGAAGRVQVAGGIYLGPTPRNTVASNWVLGWWVDGKVFSIPMIVVLIWLAISAAPSFGGRLLILALGTAMFSNVTMVPITWFAVGLALAATRPTWSAATAPTRASRRRPLAPQPM